MRSVARTSASVPGTARAWAFAQRAMPGALGVLLLFAPLPDGRAAQVYRCTGQDGRVVYSDRPCQPEASPAVPAAPRAPARDSPRSKVDESRAQDAIALNDLLGTWSVAHLTRNGKLHLDRELMSTTWSFRPDDLVVQSNVPPRKTRHYLVRVERGAVPAALRLTAQTTAERDGWLIVAKERGDLRIAFHPDFQGRPASFDAAADVFVVRLTPYAGAGPTSAKDGCGILRAAGAYELLGAGKGQQRSSEDRNGGFECRVWRDNSIHLMVFPAGEAAYELRLKEARRTPSLAVDEVTGLDARVHTFGSGGNVTFLAYRDGKIVQLNFGVRGADPFRLRQVVGRVLDQL